MQQKTKAKPKKIPPCPKCKSPRIYAADGSRHCRTCHNERARRRYASMVLNVPEKKQYKQQPREQATCETCGDRFQRVANKHAKARNCARCRNEANPRDPTPEEIERELQVFRQRQRGSGVLVQSDDEERRWREVNYIEESEVDCES